MTTAADRLREALAHDVVEIVEEHIYDPLNSHVVTIEVPKTKSQPVKGNTMTIETPLKENEVTRYGFLDEVKEEWSCG